jgi:hypothetical protein
MTKKKRRSANFTDLRSSAPQKLSRCNQQPSDQSSNQQPSDQSSNQQPSGQSSNQPSGQPSDQLSDDDYLEMDD